MNYGICSISIVPMRATPAHRSEMVNQLLFGEIYTVLEKEQGWHRIRLEHDGYEGWIHELQSTLIDDQEYERLVESYSPCTLDIVQMVVNEDRKTAFPLVIGSTLPGIEEVHFQIAGETYRYEGQISDASEVEDADTEEDLMDVKHNLMTEAMSYRHAPYLWGGRSPMGIDCSGLTQMIFRLKNVSLPRDAAQQAGSGETVNLLEEARPADLAFFDDEEGRIIHVGILVDRNHILHASGQVRVDMIDHQGIYHEKDGKYTHKLRLIKRIF